MCEVKEVDVQGQKIRIPDYPETFLKKGEQKSGTTKKGSSGSVEDIPDAESRPRRGRRVFGGD